MEYSWLQITRTSRQLESNFCFPSDHFCIIFPRQLELRFKRVKRWEKNKNNNNKKKRCTEIQDIEFNCKQPRHFFVRLYFLSLKFSVHSPVSYQALLLNSLFTISIFISCCLWSEVLSKISYWCCCSHTVYCKLVK